MIEFPPFPPARRRIFAVIVVVLFLTAAVRFHLLGAQSFWNDEGSSYVQATRSFADIAANAARDIHPPGYYWLLALWRLIAGETEFALRSLSALASVLTVALTYAAGRRISEPLAAGAAAVFVALNTFSIYYAQEARMYALLALWAAASMWALAKFLNVKASESRSITRWALALALLNAAGLWTQYAYPFILLAQGVVFLGWLAERGQRGLSTRTFALYAAANLFTMLLFLPWLPTALERITSWPNTGDAAAFSAALGMILGWFTLGVTYAQTSSNWVAIGLMLALFGLTFRREHDGSTHRWLLPFAWAALPLLLFLASGLFREANLKFLLPSQLGFALLMGRGVQALWMQNLSGRPSWVRRAPRLAAAAALLGMVYALWPGLEPLYHDPDFQRADYRGIAQSIVTQGRPGDAIILNAPNQEEVFRYYYYGEVPVFPVPPGLGGNDDETRAIVQGIINDYERIFVLFWGEAERDPNRVVETTLGSEAFEARSDWVGDVRLVRYATPVELGIVRDSGANFGSVIMLERFALSAVHVQPGDMLQLRLDWRADSALATRYKVFVQLLDGSGVLAAQRDSEPGGGLALTTTWTPGAVIADNHALLIPDNLSPANYSLIIGLYNIDNPQERLPTANANFLTLSQITVEAP